MTKKARWTILGVFGVILIGYVIYMLIFGLGRGEKVFFAPTADNRADVETSEEDGVSATNTIGFQLIGQAGEENLIVANTAMANLLQLFAGGDQEQKQEVDAIMGSEGDMKETFAALNNRLEEHGGYRNVSGLWANKGIKADSAFVEANKYFRTYFVSLDLSQEKAAEKINQTIKEAGGDRLPGISSLKDTGLVLAGGVVFEGRFENAFAGVEAKNVAFAGTKESREVEMLEQVLAISLYEDDKLQFGILPLQNEYSLEICIPRSFGATRPTSKQWDAYSQDGIATPTKVVLPRMELTSSKDVVQMLKDLGLDKVFSKGREGGDGQLFLNQVDNFCQVSIAPAEQGGEALTPDATLSCTVPFYFAIKHNESGVRILTGQYTNPQ